MIPRGWKTDDAPGYCAARKEILDIGTFQMMTTIVCRQ
jgi:hypothetical protein